MTIKLGNKKAWLQGAILVLAAAIVFMSGLAVGDGSINIFDKKGITGLPTKLDYSSVNAVYKALRQNYDGKLTETQVLNGLKHGLAASANDPYTVYFTPAEAKAFNDDLNPPDFGGIGAELGEDQYGNIQVIAPIDGTPAAAAGIQPGDLIATVNGQSTQGWSVDEAVSKIRGKEGTNVSLQIVRGQQEINLSIKRAIISQPTVTYKIIDGDIGYMQINSFGDDTSDLAKKAADEFAADHVKGIILDLRNNGGGLLNAAINVSSLWLPAGKQILTERTGSKVVATYGSLGDDELNGIKTAILVNDGTASASEITTGALHDNGLAYVIGEKTYGKGVVQTLINFSDGSQLKVTTASWYRPDGKNINHLGITPDKKVTEPTSALMGSTTNDPQLVAALTYLGQ